MKVFRMRPAQLDLLGDLYQSVLAALFKGRGVAKIVCVFATGWRPLNSLRPILGLFDGKSSAHRPVKRNIRAHDPSQDAVRFAANAFDTRHQVNEVLKFAE